MRSLAMAWIALVCAASVVAQEVPADETRPNRPAPDFEHAKAQGGTFALRDAVKNGYVILAFGRGAW
jgi:hypothetical protein